MEQPVAASGDGFGNDGFDDFGASGFDVQGSSGFGNDGFDDFSVPASSLSGDVEFTASPSTSRHNSGDFTDASHQLFENSAFSSERHASNPPAAPSVPAPHVPPKPPKKPTIQAVTSGFDNAFGDANSVFDAFGGPSTTAVFKSQTSTSTGGAQSSGFEGFDFGSAGTSDPFAASGGASDDGFGKAFDGW